MLRLLAGFVLPAMIALAPPAGAEAITVFAAASLKTALDEVAAGFEAATGHEVAVSYAGSSLLARQVQQGAPADVILSASPDWMDVLERDGLLATGTRRDLLGNRLVLIGHGAAWGTAPSLNDLPRLLGEGRLAMALVDAVPAGLYGKAALQSLGLWGAVAEQVAQTDNARAALALVATGEAPLGIVYATDAAASPKVTVLGVFPEESHPPIIYPVAAIAGRAGPAVLDFLDALDASRARAAFEGQGFMVLGAGAGG